MILFSYSFIFINPTFIFGTVSITDNKESKLDTNATTLPLYNIQQQPQDQEQLSQNLNTTQNENQVNISAHGLIDSFKTSGKINSIIVTSSSRWNSTGLWNLIVDDGKVKNFTTKMAWVNGTSGHTHEFLHFGSKGKIKLPADNILTINGKMDVATNGKISWKGVPSTIEIGGGGKTMTILLDHDKTHHHFAGQPITGTVTSLTPCSGKPGPSMEISEECN